MKGYWGNFALGASGLIILLYLGKKMTAAPATPNPNPLNPQPLPPAKQ